MSNAGDIQENGPTNSVVGRIRVTLTMDMGFYSHYDLSSKVLIGSKCVLGEIKRLPLGHFIDFFVRVRKS